jgi:Reverse transcriptase (RNA-dependent DNA polymerase)
MERTIVQCFLYPAFLSSPPSLSFIDQFAFRPYGSASAAIIFLLYTVTNLLLSNPYIIVYSIDSSKAFDTARHTTLMKKLAELDLPDQVYNWLAAFFTGHSHCTVYCGQTPTLKTITASIIHGSAIGTAAYVVTASDLKAVTRGNLLCKFADDNYLIIPAINVESRTAEVENIEAWARTNNLTLKRSKTKEIIFIDKRRRRQVAPPPPIADIIRVTSLIILGISIMNGLSCS